jgi:hypothetical protein
MECSCFAVLWKRIASLPRPSPRLAGDRERHIEPQRIGFKFN